MHGSPRRPLAPDAVGSASDPGDRHDLVAGHRVGAHGTAGERLAVPDGAAHQDGVRRAADVERDMGVLTVTPRPEQAYGVTAGLPGGAPTGHLGHLHREPEPGAAP